MKGILIVVFDKLSKLYSSPVLTENEDTAKRWFAGVVRQKGEDCSDYELYKVADFDSTTGIIEPIALELLQKGVDYFEK